jgi:uncharacterized membrane protein
MTLELLRHVFGWVCGQNPAHTWSPGGELLPLCQRCTGLYVGAFVAVLLHLAWRPAPTARWLGLNGAFLLLMVPFGYHWVPQNAEVRCGSGILFGFGLVAFLWLAMPGKFTIYDLRSTREPEGHGDGVNRKSQIANDPAVPRVNVYKFYSAGLLAALVLTPLLAENGNGAAAGILSVVCAAGAAVLAALVPANLYFLLRRLVRRDSAAA